MLVRFRIVDVADTLDIITQRVRVVAEPEDMPAGELELWLTEEEATGVEPGGVLEVTAAEKVSTTRACCTTGACGSFEA